ncbi:MAG: hypothetical protein ABEJ62_00145 [Candidatus Nanohaloarchaea archaeon]
MTASYMTAAGVIGVISASAVALHHAYHASSIQGVLHSSLDSHYRATLPYVVMSGIVSAFFFASVAFQPRLSALLGAEAVMDGVFLALSVIWTGTVYRVFRSLEDMSERFFTEGGGSGD